MTTKPKAKRFRIRRPGATESATGAEPDRPAVPTTPPKPAAPGSAAQRGSAPRGSAPAAPPPQTDLDAIRQEGLTGRQLRMARRMAQKHNLPAESDFEAVSLLRQKGIDPFQSANMLELVVPRGGAEQHEGGAPDAMSNLPAGMGKVQLPTRIETAKQALPSTELSPSETRTREISAIQRDIAQRRRKRMALLASRLAFFVMLPTLLAGWYFYVAATPMYATKSEFLILQADGAGGQALGGLLTGTQFATNQDAIAVQSYLQSKDAMLRLDRDVGFKSHFTQDWIDPIQRLSADPSNEEAYKTFKKNVKIGYDPTEGVVRMEVAAASPQVATDFSTKLISYAEERVNELSQQKRGDQMKQALEAFQQAEAERRKAQQELIDLQVQGSLLDPEAVIASIRSQINSVELQIQEKQLELAALLDNARPNRSRVEGAEGDIRRLEVLLSELNAKMTDASQGENSLASLSVRLQMAQADLATRDLLLQSALQQVEQTRMEANRQVRYLTISVEPVPSQEPSYPRAFENTILAFLIFSGIYLMISLTASILREQVTS